MEPLAVLLRSYNKHLKQMLFDLVLHLIVFTCCVNMSHAHVNPHHKTVACVCIMVDP